MKAIYFGFNPPFLTDSGIVMPLQTDERLIKNDILQLLLTVPGEREFRPTFGSPLRPTVFEQIDQFTITTLQNGILDAISKNEPRVNVLNITTTPQPDSNTIKVSLSMSLTIDPNIQFELDVDFPIVIK